MGNFKKNGSFPPFLPAAQPVSLERKHIPIIYKEKLDGIRMGLVCWGNKAFFVDRRMKTKKLNFSVPDEFYDGTILDGELMPDGKYIVYDGVIICGIRIKNFTFIKRLYYLRRYLFNLPISIKKFYYIQDIKQLIYNKTDGLIFTPCYDRVRIATHESMFKWKSLENITIDFKVKDNKIYLQDRNVPVYVSKPDWASKYADNSIVECCYVNNEWKPIKIRIDKDYPNSIKTFDSTMKSIHENIKIQEIIQPL